MNLGLTFLLDDFGERRIRWLSNVLTDNCLRGALAIACLKNEIWNRERLFLLRSIYNLLSPSIDYNNAMFTCDYDVSLVSLSTLDWPCPSLCRSLGELSESHHSCVELSSPHGVHCPIGSVDWRIRVESFRLNRQWCDEQDSSRLCMEHSLSYPCGIPPSSSRWDHLWKTADRHGEDIDRKKGLTSSQMIIQRMLSIRRNEN